MPSSASPNIHLSPDWASAPAPFKHTWRAVGNIDQFRWLSRADILEHLAMARDEIGVRHVRAAAMYGPEMRINAPQLKAWREKSSAQLNALNWQMVDLNIERLLDLGLKPIYTTCFTPQGFTDSEETCWPDRNPIGMPRDLNQWGDFVAAGLAHHIRRFGREEMRTWLFECWNEPNLKGFFDGSQEDFFRLWSATWRVVKAADPAFRFGGPSTARGEWITEFLDWTEADGTPPDYLISHVYNNDSESEPLSPFDGPASHRVKDSPHFASGVIRGLRAELDKREWKGEVHWNEWGRSWFPTDRRREAGLEAAFIVKTMAEVSQYGDAFAFWCLSDVYDQIGFQCSEFEGHYGLLSLHGLRKPGWFAHLLLNRLLSTRVAVIGGSPLRNAIATVEANRGAVLVYAYPENGDSDAEDESSTFRVQLPHGARNAEVTLLDSINNNIIHQWRTMGSPESPSPAQIATLRKSNTLKGCVLNIDPDYSASVEMACPGVALIEFDFPSHGS